MLLQPSLKYSKNFSAINESLWSNNSSLRTHHEHFCPLPWSTIPYSVLNHLLVDDMFIELTDSKLGQGSIGFVFKGYVYPKTQTKNFKQKMFAAVKMSYPMPQKSMGLLEEAARMANLNNHENVVKIIAVSKLSFSAAFRPMFAMEWLAGGSLQEFFREEIRRRDPIEQTRVYVRDILHILRQIGNALKYIHESKDQALNEFSHGDVAARNVLLTERNLSSCVAKLGDFGLPLDFGPKLPIPWLPPEIVCSLNRTNTKHRPESDVWMFGVLMFECATLGAEPHYQRTFEEIVECFELPDRGLAFPSTCPPEYIQFALDCFGEAHRRPHFTGPILDSPTSSVYRLNSLYQEFQYSKQQFKMIENVTNCTCSQHRCGVPLPSFTISAI